MPTVNLTLPAFDSDVDNLNWINIKMAKPRTVKNYTIQVSNGGAWTVLEDNIQDNGLDLLSHRDKKQYFYEEYSQDVKSAKGIEKINLQRKVNKLKIELDNYDNLFGEYKV